MIYLIRHARPVVSGRLLGNSDVPLAETVIDPLDLAVDRVLTSPLLRARHTAERLFPGAALQVLPALKERNLGAWELKTWTEVELAWPEEAAEAMRDWFGMTPPEGESWVEFCIRVESAWNEIPMQGNTAIVAHAGVNSVLWHLATDGDPGAFRQDYLEVISLAFPD
ncbi:MAG TPA: histidine phosphatase family protein [Bryobacteraceae bacterium]|nr:histidine phosphatase family protein [Bryobacteraceae bacterium]